MTRHAWSLGLVMALAALLAALPGVASAADPVTLRLQAPGQVAVGATATVTAVLQDASGRGVPNAEVLLWTNASFLSTAGVQELGRATTDATGVATFTYQARSGGAVTVSVSFMGNSRYAPALASAKLLETGSAQVYQQTAGVRVPGLGVWLLAAVLGVVWAIYLSVMVVITLIARDGTKPVVAPSYGLGGRRE